MGNVKNRNLIFYAYSVLKHKREHKIEIVYMRLMSYNVVVKSTVDGRFEISFKLPERFNNSPHVKLSAVIIVYCSLYMPVHTLENYIVTFTIRSFALQGEQVASIILKGENITSLIDRNDTLIIVPITVTSIIIRNYTFLHLYKINNPCEMKCYRY